MSTTSHIIDLLVAERSRLQAAIDALSPASTEKKKPKGGGHDGTHIPKVVIEFAEDPPSWVTSPTPLKTAAAPALKKRKVSAAARKRMAEGQRKRYAALNAAKVDATAPRKTNSVKIAEAIAPTKEDAEFKSKMSIAMAKSWAKRKKAAKKA